MPYECSRNENVRPRHLVFQLIALLAMLSTWPNHCLAQNEVDFQTLLINRVALSETDLTALDRGEALVKLLPSREKTEVSVGGLVQIETTSETFLKSFRENMAHRTNPAILETGKFSNRPVPDDLQKLTIEDRDLEDLKECVVHDCKLKLSAMMIERLRKEVNWEALNYKPHVTQLIKQMWVDYVSDYLKRGDAALIQYDDKEKGMRVVENTRQLLAASGYDALLAPSQNRNLPKPKFEMIENAIVWSKIKYGLKPVIAIDHITIYKALQDGTTQILIMSKQIYANHYFDSSLALTAFLTVPGEVSKSYLFYENRSRLDGFDGVFGKFKRDIVEHKAVESLKSILHQSQLTLRRSSLRNNDQAAAQTGSGGSLKRWKLGGIAVLILLLGIAGLASFLGLRAYGYTSFSRGAHY